MPKKKTWIWILVACGAVCIVGLLAMATAGVIFVSHHIQAHASTSAFGPSTHPIRQPVMQ